MSDWEADGMSDETHYYGDGHDHAAVEGGAGAGYGPSGPEGANERPYAARPVLPLPLDLNDPVVENEVADAIRRLAPHGEYVPLSQRYPWRFSEPTVGVQQTTLVDAVVVALRESASVHDAERIPHLVAPLHALADALESGALITAAPPGRCGEPGPTVIVHGDPEPSPYSCDLRFGHTGQHESRYYPPVAGLTAGLPVAWWSDVVDAEVVEDDEVLVEDTWFERADLPDALARHMRSLTESGRETKRLVIRLERLSAIVSEGEQPEQFPDVRAFAARLRAVFLDPDPEVTP